MRFKISLFQFFGNPEDKTLEDQFPVILSFATAILSLVAMSINIIIGLSPIMVLIPLGASLAMFFVYYKLRFSVHKYAYKLLMAAIAFIYFNFLWFHNYGSSGPTLYLFLLFFIFLIVIFDGKSRFFLSSLLVFNILVLFLTEFFVKDITNRYSDDQTRMIDIYFSLFIYLAFTSVLALVIRFYYRLERSNAQKSDQLKSAFLSNMSHEIRTPMAAILGFSKLLDYTQSDKERTEFVEIINENGKMLMQLLDDIIDISRMDAGQFDTYKKGFSLNEVLFEIKKIIRLNLDQQGKQQVNLTLQIPPGEAAVYTDEIRLRQILVNLLSNAAKFTMEGDVSFGYKLNGKDAEFFVSDSGIGIKPEYLNQIFNRFYKIENLEYAALPRGSGIGLSIVKLLVEKLGGNITVNSVHQKGTTFRFLLPDILIEALPRPVIKAPELYPFSDENRILIVEDDESNMMLIVNVLKKMGVQTYQAVDGVLAVEVFKQNDDINMVLLDINLPFMNGFEVLQKLKEINPAVPVVALTAYAMASDREKAIQAGFSDYLTKPVYQNELSACLEKYLITIPARINAQFPQP
jgi:signal transduction histidine kinase/CheY-like chemotaxis protein